MKLNGCFRVGLRGLRAVSRGLLTALPLLFLLPSCGDDNVAPGPTPTPDTDFQGTFDPNSGELEFSVQSPGGVAEPFLKLIATNVAFDNEGLLHAQVAIRNTGTESVPGPAGVMVSDFQPPSVYPTNASCPVPADSVPIDPSPGPWGPCFFDHRGTYGEDGLLATGETSVPVEWIFGGTQGESFAFHAQLVTEPVPPGDGVIAGIVFEDHNENGQRDWNEPGIAGVGVGLELADFVAIDVTDAEGRYSFEVQAAGLYTLIMSVPTGARPTTPVQMQVLIVQRDDGSLSSFLDGNFGLVRGLPAEYFVDGFVYMDHNRNGQRDRDEEGVPDVGVGASGLECMLPVIGIDTTDANGFYEISNTNVGCPLPWMVQRMPMPGYIGTSPDPVILEHLPPGSNRMQVNFGIAPEDSTHQTNVTIEGVVFLDTNFNGVREDDEMGLAGVQIQLVSPCEVLRVTTTNDQGFYQFLPDVVRVCPVTAVWQWLPLYRVHTTPNPVEVQLPTVTGNHLLRIDFGIGPER